MGISLVKIARYFVQYQCTVEMQQTAQVLEPLAPNTYFSLEKLKGQSNLVT